MIERFYPELVLEAHSEDDYATMEAHPNGEWVRLETVLDWLKEQRSGVDDVPMGGVELVNTFAFECGMGGDYFKE